MRTWPLWVGLAVAGCNQILGVHDLGGSVDAADDTTADASGLPECTVQRVVHIVAGNGGLAWFTIAWPPPAVIEHYAVGYAYDDPTFAKGLTVDTAHPLYARRVGASAIWLGRGTHPQPTAFVAGFANAHQISPTDTTVSGGVSIDALAASLQRALHPQFEAVVIGALEFGTAPNAPVPVSVPSATMAPSLFTDQATQDQVRPTSQQLARYYNGTEMTTNAIAEGLAFSANAFKLGLVSTVMLPGYQDDPHMAFASPGLVTMRGDDLARLLDTFYADLEGATEATCGHAGQPLALADNVMVIVDGDTPKDPFDANNWGDGSPGGANLLYVRSNGFTRPGWFGALDPALGRINFDPTTGETSTAITKEASTAAAWAGMLYAVARGDAGVVTAITSAPYAGVIAAP